MLDNQVTLMRRRQNDTLKQVIDAHSIGGTTGMQE